MKHLFTRLVALMALLLPVTASAYSFMAGGLAYEINSDTTVSVTYTEYLSNSNYSGLTEANIPESVSYNGKTYSVTSIGKCAFSRCSGLTSVTIPNSVTLIGSNAFSSCSGLTSVTIPNSVTSIGSWAFSDCSGLVTIKVESGNMKYDSRDNCNAIIETATNTLHTGCNNTIIPNSVTEIGRSAFFGCSSLTSVTIGNSVTSIGEYAFGECSCLTSVNIPNSVTSIDNRAFYLCWGLTNITIPNSVTSIGYRVFGGCRGLETIKVESSNVKYDSRGNCNAIIETATNTLITGCKNSTIPNSVTSIGNYAFDCTGLTSVTIGNSVTSIGNSAFHGCYGLTSVTIPNSVTYIGREAFSYCWGLTNVTIPNSVTSIGGETFLNCSSLKELSLTGKGEWNIDVPDLNFSQIKTLNVGSEISSLGGKGFDLDVVKSYAEVPPMCTDGTFANYNAQLHMPTSATAAYFTAPYWQNFNNIVNDITQKVRLDKSSIDVKISDEQQLHATVTPASMAGEVVWCSSNPAVARVDENGKVIMLAKGECDIFASLSSIPAVYASCHVGVHPFINLDITKASIAPNQILTLTPSFAPEETDIVVTSSNPGVAAARVVSQDSVKKVLVVGVSLGKATITVASTNADYIPATCVVTVREGGDGDVDGNGIVDVDDVNAVINLILFYEQYKDRYTGNPDIDGNGLIDVDDVNEIINIILES